MALAGKRIKLYTGLTSSSSWRVRITLALKGLSYEAIWLDSKGGGPAKKLHELGQVPVLDVDGKLLTQSVAICEYLEEVLPTGLMPQDPFRRAYIREVVEIINSGIQPLQNSAVLARFKDDDARLDWARHYVRKGLQALTRAAERHNSHQLFFAWATEPTFAEVFLIPQLSNASRYGIDLEREFPRLKQIETHVLQTYPAFRDTKPPDANTVKVSKL